MSWTNFPFFQIIGLSSARQFALFGVTLWTTWPSGRSASPALRYSTYGLMSMSASPMWSSPVNVSWSNTDWKKRTIHKSRFVFQKAKTLNFSTLDRGIMICSTGSDYRERYTCILADSSSAVVRGRQSCSPPIQCLRFQTVKNLPSMVK